MQSPPRKVFDARLRSLTAQHRRLGRRYEIAYHVNDFVAGLLFTIGSVLFFWESTMQAGTWLFVVGSVQFTLRPGISLMRDLHLLRLPANED